MVVLDLAVVNDSLNKLQETTLSINHQATVDLDSSNAFEGGCSLPSPIACLVTHADLEIDRPRETPRGLVHAVSGIAPTNCTTRRPKVRAPRDMGTDA